MKNRSLTFAFIVFLSMCAFASPVYAGDYLGDYCFRAGTIENDTRLMKLGISDMGGNHYQIAGTWNWEDGTNRLTPINGNIELIDNNLEAALTFSFYDSEYIYYRVAHMELDTATLSGKIRMLKSKFEFATNSVGHGKSIMPVSIVTCPE